MKKQGLKGIAPLSEYSDDVKKVCEGFGLRMVVLMRWEWLDFMNEGFC